MHASATHLLLLLVVALVVVVVVAAEVLVVVAGARWVGHRGACGQWCRGISGLAYMYAQANAAAACMQLHAAF